jgi:hypothetical protein
MEWENRRLNTVRMLTLAGLLGLASTCCGQVLDSAGGMGVIHRGRLIGTTIGGGAIIAGTLIGLDQAWYGQYEREPFHFFDDGGEWQALDKVGHVFATYTVGRWGHGLLRWCGVPQKTALWAGGTLGLVYLSAVEYMDGHSAGWGFSTWDMMANAAGTGLFIGQELGWGEQRIKLKYSAHLTPYAKERPDLLGKGLSERILKDYNGSTYWVSANLHAFGWKAPPVWLNLAVGYGADGMLRADPAPGQVRQYFLSADVDLERIPTKSKALRTALLVLNCVKVPLPALEFRSDGRVLAHGLYF